MSSEGWTTIQFGYPHPGLDYIGDRMAVVLTTAGEVRAAYKNGEPTTHDHPAVLALLEEWNPPSEFIASGMLGPVALFDRPLTQERIQAHFDAPSAPAQESPDQ